MLETPQRFIYIDTEAINSLYSQAETNIGHEQTRRLEEGADSNIKGSLSLKVLYAIFGIGVDVSNSNTTKTIIESKSVLSIEQKLKLFSLYIDSLSGGLFDNIDDAATHALAKQSSIYVCCHDYFNMPQFYNSQDAVQALDNSKHFEFEIGKPNGGESEMHDYSNSDTYYKVRVRPRIVMSASMSKFPNLAHGFYRSSHEAIYFCGHKGVKVPLNVFGEIRHIVDFFQIKPYALWV